MDQINGWTKEGVFGFFYSLVRLTKVFIAVVMKRKSFIWIKNMGLFGMFLVTGLILMLIPIAISLFEKKNTKLFQVVHILINILFILVSFYFINFVPVHGHGPSLVMFAIPAWPSFMLFYFFIYSRILKENKTKVLSLVIPCIYLIGCLIGLVALMDGIQYSIDYDKYINI